MTVRAAGLGGVARPRGRQRTRDAVIETALRLFTERGYLAVRVEDIAREAGVSRATFYRYFSEREDILSALFEWLLGAEPPGGEEPDGEVGATTFERVRTTAHQAVDVMLQREELARFVYRLPVRHDSLLRPADDTTPGAFRHIHRLVEEGVERGEIRDDAPIDVLCGHVHSALETAMRDWATDRIAEPYERLDLLLDMVFRGVAGSPGANGSRGGAVGRGYQTIST